VELESTIQLTKEVCLAPNLCDRLTDKDLETIGGFVVEGYLHDKSSRASWESRVQAALDLALQLQQDKTFPWPGASNVKFPLVTIAALQWHARAYPALIQGNEIVQMRVLGPDQDGQRLQRALRVGKYMSYQLLEESDQWEAEHDRALLTIPIVGCAFKKTYRDGVSGRNVSEMVSARDLYLNYWAKSVEECERKTHRIPTQKNKMYSMMVGGIYRDCRGEAWYDAGAHAMDNRARENLRTGLSPVSEDDFTPFHLLEQHVRFDLDGDGYDEPYIVTVDEGSKTTLRVVTAFDYDDIKWLRKKGGDVVASIPAEQYFTKYGFIPSPDGGIYDIGFGVLLGPINESVSTIINQLIDSGTMSVMAGGFLGRGAKIKGGNQNFNPFQWNPVDSTGEDLAKSVFPLPVREPSSTLFNLLSLLIDYTNRVSGATDIMVGENPGQNTPAQTSQSMIEQGSKINAAVFKRVWRSMKEEFQKLYLLNKKFVPVEVAEFGEKAGVISSSDFTEPDRFVRPAADPNLVSDTQAVQQASMLLQRVPTGGYDADACEIRFLQAARVQDWQRVFFGREKIPPAMNPKVQQEQLKQEGHKERAKERMQEKLLDLQATHEKDMAEIDLLRAEAAQIIHEMGADAAAHEVEKFDRMIKAVQTRDESNRAYMKLMQDQQGLDIQKQQVEQQGQQAGPGAGGQPAS